MTKTLAKNTRHTSDRLKTSYYIDGNGRHVWMFQCGIMLRAKLWQQASRSKCRLLEDYDKALGMIAEATAEAESDVITLEQAIQTGITTIDRSGILDEYFNDDGSLKQCKKAGHKAYTEPHNVMLKRVCQIGVDLGIAEGVA